MMTNAEKAAVRARNTASQWYQAGCLGKFERGYVQGMLEAVYFDLPAWLFMGFENEVKFFCRRANEERQ